MIENYTKVITMVIPTVNIYNITVAESMPCSDFLNSPAVTAEFCLCAYDDDKQTDGQDRYLRSVSRNVAQTTFASKQRPTIN